MKHFTLVFLTHFWAYVYENLSCLLYVVEVVPEQAIYFTSYFALVKDIAEAYGSWLALAFVIISALTVMTAVQQQVTNSINNFKLSGRTNPNSNINQVSTDKYFTNFFFFKFFRRK